MVYSTRAGNWHWQRLLTLMGREDLKDDPRFINNTARVAHYDETEALVNAWTAAHTRAEIFAATSKYKIPCAPVRDLEEVMHDPHMHGRGMLETVHHYDYEDPIVLGNSPLRVHGTDKVPTQLSPHVGEHNRDVYNGLLGLSDTEFERLREAGVI
jgi:crotonobetainyl-CoA:carnitine CoA-transferase CaiB-like acyl-CoA transferase